MFPVFSVSGNQLVSLEGEASSLYKVMPPDLEQMEDSEYVFRELSRALANQENDWVKLYHLKGEFWINSKSRPELASCNVSPEERPISLFFDDLNSNIDFYEDYFVYNGAFQRICSLKEFFPIIEYPHLSQLDFCICLRSLGQYEAKGKLKAIPPLVRKPQSESHSVKQLAYSHSF